MVLTIPQLAAIAIVVALVCVTMAAAFASHAPPASIALLGLLAAR